MKSNFDFLKGKEDYDYFAQEAIEAERAMVVSPSASAALSRKAMELAIKYVYEHDADVYMPYETTLSALMYEPSFKNILSPGLLDLLTYIRKLGNLVLHENKRITRDQAVLALKDLFEFLDWLDYSYSTEYEPHSFDESLLLDSNAEVVSASELKALQNKISSKSDEIAAKDEELEKAIAENDELRKQMAKVREQNTGSRIFRIDTLTEAETRKSLIDIELQEAGWVIDGNCTLEVPITGMPTTTGTGFVDYVLWGKDNLPLGVVEAKKATVDSIVGSQQAKLYADCLQNQYGQRPLIFTSNGYEIFYTNDYMGYPRREVAGFLTQEELQLEVDRRKQRKPLVNIEISDNITNRPYQKEAVTAVCDAIAHKHRKMLIVQATGSGKTRVSISIVDVLRRHNYVKNVLFLADRTALVKQAKNNYTNLLPDLSCCNLLENKDDPESCRMIFSTYPTMMNAIDEKKNKEGSRLFTPGHFDLIICDEVHRSIYKKYQAIFDYFDAMLLGMTATPKNEIDRNTYGVFDLERGVPTFAYELDKAVEEGYLVNYSTLEYKTKIMEDGIHYDELSEEEKEVFDNLFEADETIDEDISSDAVNSWLFNSDTIDKVLKELMEKGLKIEGGDKLGKTIIFAKNSLHAKAIVERFNKLFPELGGDFIKQIDYSIKYCDTLIDDFSTKEKMPQIAVSVDMLDTGIDIPEILNLVFFKKVKSYSKFWQMIGRGTRLCPDLLGEGQNKTHFLIFDFCNNFEFFRVNKNGTEGGLLVSLSEKIYNTKTLICRELQSSCFTDNQDYIDYRVKLVNGLHEAVVELNTDSFLVKMNMRYVQTYRDLNNWNDLETAEISEIKDHIAPIIQPDQSDELARRFDHLMYSIQLGILQSKNVQKPINIVVATAELLSEKMSIPQVAAQRPIVEKVQTQDFWDEASILDIEEVRAALRNLLQYLDKKKKVIYYTDFEDEIVDMAEGTPLHVGDQLENYRKKVEYYLKSKENTMSVYKLRHNKPLTEMDMKELERILWTELGSKDDYIKEYGDTPVGRLVRKIVGMERADVNEAFSKFLSDEKLNLNQIRFVNLIVDYIVANGNIEDNRVLMNEPFKSVGSMPVLFKDNMSTARDILNIVEKIKANSEQIAL
ncbi:type I restriction enzyme, R subunit [Oribacterium sp. KHPX15]|uniref:DEAD/DEAH box helicase family protein n=1 Tax=Oribacterium sp. KHPX15 TaxID=1855342 RepID=UPI00089B3C75|nr:DEAD/DEAH box helicase family protein [Oribacterium sp. KHPX15]SEA04518.1 type I restriction enzyme, R subunit [Oribacterium sp. KHPX15]